MYKTTTAMQQYNEILLFFTSINWLRGECLLQLIKSCVFIFPHYSERFHFFFFCDL